MYYKHNLNLTYPERSDEHMLTLESTREINLDKNYDYMPHGVGFKIQRAVVATLLHLIVFPLMHLTHGLRIYGKKNLKKHQMKDGMISVRVCCVLYMMLLRKRKERINNENHI